MISVFRQYLRRNQNQATNMHSFRSMLIAVFLALLSSTTAVPKGSVIDKKDTVPLALDCIVSALALASLPSPFTLSVITDKDPIPWTVIFTGIQTLNGYQPSITRSNISEPEFEPFFRLTNGKLTVGPGGDNNLTAYFGPSLSDSPLSFNGLYFGNVTSENSFCVINSCDANGSTYLELRTSQCKGHHTPFSINHSPVLLLD